MRSIAHRTIHSDLPIKDKLLTAPPRCHSGGSENLAEPLLGVSEILVVEPPGGFRVLGLGRGHALLGALLLLLGTLTLGLDGLEETRGRVRLELEVAVLAADDPGDDELPGEGILVELGGVGFGLGLRWRECDVELLRRGGSGEGAGEAGECADGDEREGGFGEEGGGERS